MARAPNIIHGQSGNGWVKVVHLKNGLVNVSTGFAGKTVTAEIVDRAALIAALNVGV